MKTILSCLILLSAFVTSAQKTFQLKADHLPTESKRQWQEMLFQGIEQLEYSLPASGELLDRDYRLVIKEYQEGQLKSETVVLDTREENLPKIDSAFQFILMTQNIINHEKIGFFFPRFMNKKSFETRKELEGDFSLRKINVRTESLDFILGEPFQIALITPPNRDPKNGDLRYCEVSQGG